MENIDLSEFENTDISLHHFVGFVQHWKHNASFNCLSQPRPNNGLTYILCHEALYRLPDGNTLRARQNSIVYIPEQSNYQVSFSVDQSVTPVSTLLINFLLTDGEGKRLVFGRQPTILYVDHNKQFLSDFEEIVSLCFTKNNLKTKGMLYTMLHHIWQKRQAKEVDAIENAVSYIDRHLTGEGMTLPLLARRFAMSETTFRRKFRERMGMSPIAYINLQKVERAKMMLNSVESTVEAICDALNYYDTAYFYKQFKKATGMTPMEYKLKMTAR